nr:hypothetical protein [Tanacetum cinerariifolium]
MPSWHLPPQVLPVMIMRDNALVELRKKFEKAEQEIDELKLKLDKFQTSLKNLSQLLASQTNDKTGLGYDNQVFNSFVFDCDEMFSSESDVSMPTSLIYDRYKSGEGYHAVPPHYTGTFMPPKPDLVFHDAPTVNETVPIAFNVKPSSTKPIQDLSQSNRPSTPIIKDWVSDSEDDYEGKHMPTQKAPSFVQPAEHVKTPRPSVTLVEHPIPAANLQTNIPNSRGHRNSRIRKPVRNHALRGNYQHYATHPNPQRHVVPTAVLTRSRIVPLSAAKPVNATIPQTKGNPHHALKDKGVIDSGCLRHMTGNMSYLTNFEKINGGYVAFELKFNLFSVSQMCDKKNSFLFTNTECIVLSSDFKLPDENHVLLRVPRENNMYNVDLKNIVPLGDLTCRFAKATLDESNLWHRRLSHINFKTMNKLVKGNLVKGLPSKVFENEHVLLVRRESNIEALVSPSLSVLSANPYKGIKREFSVARTPQHNRIAKRKNRNLIEAARTMIADSLLPILFWAEAVNTTCYVQNRVLVTKPHNKTHYELLLGRTPNIGFMRPFGYPMTILNTLDPLGKFDGKADEGFLVGYSVSSKAFRVFNSRTRIIQETLHINFLENQPNVSRSRPTWLFDIDTLTKFMNYHTVIEGNQPNPSAEPKLEVKEPEFVAPISPSSSAKIKKHNDKTKREAKGKSPVELSIGFQNLSEEFEDFFDNNINEVNAASTPVPAVGQILTNSTNTFSAPGPSNTAVSPTLRKYSYVDPSQYLDDPNMPTLEDITYSDNEEDVGAEADFSNLETNIIVSPIPTTRVHKDQHVTQIIGDLSSAPQTRSMTRMVKEQEPKRVHQALKDPSWIEVIQEELLQFKMQMVWEEGIDYEEVFAPVARIEAIRHSMDYIKLLELGMRHWPVIFWRMVFQRGKIDQTLFIKKQKGNILLVQVYVDDITFGFTNKDLCKAFEKLMKDKFQMSLIGELTFFLGLQVKQKHDEIFISHDTYVAEILRKFGLTDGKSASTPIDTEKPLLKDPDGEDVDVHTYRSMISSLMYLTSSRLDIMFVVCACARFQVTPKASHLHAVKRIFRYLKGKPHLGLWYLKDSPFNLVAYSDSDYAGASLDRKSTTGGCQFLGCRLISWQCKKQTVVATSSTKAEYVAAASFCAQVIWIQNQLLDYGQKVIITEDTVRQALHLDDVESIDCLPYEEIFAELTRMGYEKPCTKMTFYKTFFSAQWKFLIHTIIQCMSAKRTACNEFSSFMASAVICLATGRKFNFSKYIFDSLVRNVDSSSKFYMVDTPLFEGMLVPQHAVDDIANVVADDVVAEDAIDPTPPSPTPTITPPPSQELPSTSQDKIAQALEITKLKQRVRRLEKKNKLKVFRGCIQTGGIIAKIDADEDVILEEVDDDEDVILEEVNAEKDAAVQGRLEESQAHVYHIDLEHADKVLSMQDDEPEPADLKKLMTELVTAAATTITAAPSVASFKMDFFKGMSYDDIRPIFEKHFNSVVGFLEKSEKELEEEASRALKRKTKSSEQQAVKKQKFDEEVEELKKHLQIVPNDEDDVYTEATPLALKVPVVDYQIHTENNKPYYKVIRTDGIHQLFLSFLNLLSNFDREDLEMLWQIVQEKFASSKPKNFSDDFLLTTLKAMFEKPDVEAHIWKNQRCIHGLAKVKSWKLLESCRVHIITFTTTQMILLVERRLQEYTLRDYYCWLKTYCCCYKLKLLDDAADIKLRPLEQSAIDDDK